MASGPGVLESAKATLSKANDLTKSVEGQVPSRFAPKPSGQHADASYKAARAAGKTSSGSSLSDEAKSAAAGLKAKQENIEQYEAASK